MANIFYGDSIRAAKNLDKYLREGIRPDVFSDKDETKCGTTLLDTYEVLPIDEALARYPDAYVWVTYQTAPRTLRLLRAKIPPEKICFLEANL